MQPEQPLERTPPSWWQRRRPAILRTLGMVLAAAALLMFARGVSSAQCWAVFALVSVLAFPVWQYRTEYLLFRRRLVLSGAARPASRIRAFLWRGGVTKVIQAVVSILLAWVLLVLVFALSHLHWAVLVVDAVFLSIIIGPITRRLRTDIKDRHRGVIARRWPIFLINGIVLSGAIMMVDFFFAGSADTRHIDWHQLAEQTFAASFNQAGCVLWGVSAGTMATLDALSWHLSELVIPSLTDVTTRLLAWSFFLLRAVTLAWLYSAFLLGICVFLDKREMSRPGRVPESTFSRSFFLTIIILAVPFLYVSLKLGEIDPHVVSEGTGVVAASIDPCRPSADSRERLVNKLDGTIAGEHRAAKDDIDSSVDRGLDDIFENIETGVDEYLDWYFTVLGEYQRLAMVFSADAATAMSEKLEQYLFVQRDFATRLDSLDSKIVQQSAARFAGIAPQLRAEIDNAPCTIGRIDLARLQALDHDSLRASTAVTSGVGAGIVASKLLAKKTTAAVIGKVAAKKSFSAGAAVVTKTLAKKGTSTALSAGLGVTLCAPAGPLAILCGVTAGLATWLAVDKALIELDESIYREEMRADILEVLAEQRALLGEQLKQKHYMHVDRLAGQMNDALQKTFIPYSDGMGS